jgi:hypothetical protein
MEQWWADEDPYRGRPTNLQLIVPIAESTGGGLYIHRETVEGR